MPIHRDVLGDETAMKGAARCVERPHVVIRAMGVRLATGKSMTGLGQSGKWHLWCVARETNGDAAEMIIQKKQPG